MKIMNEDDKLFDCFLGSTVSKHELKILKNKF